MNKIDSGGQDSLLHTVICQYKSLADITQANAEELYISIVMQLDGYGNETFTAKVKIYIFSQLLWFLVSTNISKNIYFRITVAIKLFLEFPSTGLWWRILVHNLMPNLIQKQCNFTGKFSSSVCVCIYIFTHKYMCV